MNRAAGRPTMKDVASRARVALKTVSRVVNGEPGVTPATTSRVLGAIEDLGFRRNESARLLRTGRTATIGFIADSWADPDHAHVYRGLEDVVRRHGYMLFSGSADGDPAREERLALAMCARRVDGLIISPTAGSHDYLVPEADAGVATVFVLRRPAVSDAAPADGMLASDAAPADGMLAAGAGLAAGGGLPADAVLPDERAGGRAAVAHLIAQGHRRIGFLGGAAGNRRMLAGYAEAMKAAGLAADPAWTTLEAGSLGQAPVTAVLCADRPRTEAALHALALLAPLAPLGQSGQSGQVAQPGQPGGGRGRMALVGFGDFELADLVTPGLTVVSYDPALIGRTAGELLIRRLAGDGGPPRQVEVPVRLIARGSAEFPPPDR